MRTLSLSVIDLVQNSIRSGSSVVELSVKHNSACGLLAICIKDNGCGMSDDELKLIIDPFYTSCKTHKVGLGVPLFVQRVCLTGGSYQIKSQKGIGTEISATFNVNSVDFVPLGDMTEALVCMIISAPAVRFVYKFLSDDYSFAFDTSDFFGELSVDKNTPPFIKANLIKEYLADKIIQ